MASGSTQRWFTRAALVLAMLPARATAQQVDMTLADAVQRALGVQPAIVQAQIGRAHV